MRTCAARPSITSLPSPATAAALGGGPSSRSPSRLSLCAVCTLNPTGQSRVTLSLLQERLRAACRHKQEEKGPESAQIQNQRCFSQARAPPQPAVGAAWGVRRCDDLGPESRFPTPESIFRMLPAPTYKKVHLSEKKMIISYYCDGNLALPSDSAVCLRQNLILSCLGHAPKIPRWHNLARAARLPPRRRPQNMCPRDPRNNRDRPSLNEHPTS